MDETNDFFFLVAIIYSIGLRERCVVDDIVYYLVGLARVAALAKGCQTLLFLQQVLLFSRW
jgi:hypothetical protein